MGSHLTAHSNGEYFPKKMTKIETTSFEIPKVSVILPVYNGGDNLLPAVISVIQQTFKGWELILIDDGSTDIAVEGIKNVSDPRVRIFQDGFNKGLAARLNQGIESASGAYIARMDQDDLCFPDRLERQVKFLETHSNIDLLSTRALIFRSIDARVIGLLPYRKDHESITRHPWRGMYMPHPTWMGRADWFRKFKYCLPEVVRAEDQELLLRALQESKYHSLPEVLLAYRKGEFDLRKSLRARRTLLKAQLVIFAHRNQWSQMLAALTVTTIKALVDLFEGVPGLNWIYSARMSGQVSTEEIDQFATLWENTRNFNS